LVSMRAITSVATRGFHGPASRATNFFRLPGRSMASGMTPPFAPHRWGAHVEKMWTEKQKARVHRCNPGPRAGR
jgi:hypothetical protein